MPIRQVQPSPKPAPTAGTLTLTLSSNEADVGDSVVARGVLTDEQGEPIEGATLTARASHDGREVDLGHALDERSGNYAAIVVPDAHGRWRVRLEASDPAVAKEATIHVRRTPFAGS